MNTNGHELLCLIYHVPENLWPACAAADGFFNIPRRHESEWRY